MHRMAELGGLSISVSDNESRTSTIQMSPKSNNFGSNTMQVNGGYRGRKNTHKESML